MNWGKGITIAMIIFMGFILTLVINLSIQDVQLESKNYYQKELKYGDEIKALQNAQALKTQIKLLTMEEGIAVQIPDALETQNVVIQLKRPNDENKDLNYKLEGSKTLIIPAEQLEKGVYQVEISYKASTGDCLQKETIYY